MTIRSSAEVAPKLRRERRGRQTKDVRGQTFASGVLEHRRTLGAYAHMLTRNSAAADDLVQDTIEKALRAAGQFKHGTCLRAWLTRIMRNAFTDGCRSRARWVAIDPKREEETATGVWGAEDEQEPLGGLDVMTMADVHVALAAIEAAQREIFILAHIDGVSYQAIAARLRIPVSTVGTRLLRARRKVRVVLEQRLAEWRSHAAA
jgi:RNA polymerase sigma-70 factor (ECF subfamily)